MSKQHAPDLLSPWRQASFARQACAPEEYAAKLSRTTIPAAASQAEVLLVYMYVENMSILSKR